MTDLLGLSSDVIDGRKGTDDVGPLNRINFELSEIADDVAMVEAFSHSILFRTDAGLVAFDTSSHRGAGRVVQAIRGWSDAPFHSLVYTHGHVDHVGGCGAFLTDATERGHPAPKVVGHENVEPRFQRYNDTNGYNLAINMRQFGTASRRGYDVADGIERFLPTTSPPPDVTYRDTLHLDVSGLGIDLVHARGETDDHTWGWIENTVRSVRAISSSGRFRTPGIRRKCSVSPPSGPLPCAQWLTKARSSSCRRTVFRSRDVNVFVAS